MTEITDPKGCNFTPPDSLMKIKDLTIDDLMKNEDSDSYTVMRAGHDLGVFVKFGQNYHFRDNQNNTWVCQCSNIDTGASTIEKAVEFMSYS